MKFTKKIMTMATCAVMAASSMVGMSASAVYEGGNTQAFSQSVTPYAVSSYELDNVIGYPQEYSNWCWVACTQTALKFVGVTKTQTQIYKKAKNTDTVENLTGTFADINRAITGFGETAFTTSTNPTFTGISDKIDDRYIVIIRGLKGNSTVGHDIICYGFTNDTSTGTYTLSIYDPSTLNGGEGTLTCSTKSSTNFTMTIGDSYTTTFNATNYMYGR